MLSVILVATHQHHDCSLCRLIVSNPNEKFMAPTENNSLNFSLRSSDEKIRFETNWMEPSASSRLCAAMFSPIKLTTSPAANSPKPASHSPVALRD